MASASSRNCGRTRVICETFLFSLVTIMGIDRDIEKSADMRGWPCPLAVDNWAASHGHDCISVAKKPLVKLGDERLMTVLISILYAWRLS
ncbi:hypothetical protein GGI42DRAFT_323021 [Trichoderma sp. SZMC 28013]